MTKRQRATHWWTRQERALLAGRNRHRLFYRHIKPKRVLMGHSYYEDGEGDGYTEPRESWGECTCGAILWHAVQPYGEEHYQTWEQHLVHAKRTRRPLLQNGRKP